jgi:UDP-glucose 4-epimerase
MKILIIGGFGFVGFHLCKSLLDNNCKVDIIDNISTDNLSLSDQKVLKNPNFKYIQADICVFAGSHDFDRDYDFIFHLAALLGVEAVLRNPYCVLSNNALMTVNAIAIAKKQKKLKKIFFTSTSEVYAGTLSYYGLEFPTPENTSLTISSLEDSRSSYMLSKIYGEGLFHLACIPYIILRPHNIYGPRMGFRHVIPQLLEKAESLDESGNLEVHSPSHTRTFCYVQDAVDYILRLIEIDDINMTLNLGVESPEISMKSLAEKIIAVSGKNLKIKEMPNTPGSPERRVPKTDALIQYTGYLPQISLNRGIEETYLWYQANEFNRR